MGSSRTPIRPTQPKSHFYEVRLFGPPETERPSVPKANSGYQFDFQNVDDFGSSAAGSFKRKSSIKQHDSNCELGASRRPRYIFGKDRQGYRQC
jgi:hypothetical protein